MAELWHCTPMQALEAPPHLFFEALLFHSARNQGQLDKANNERAIADAEAQAREAARQ